MGVWAWFGTGTCRGVALVLVLLAAAGARAEGIEFSITPAVVTYNQSITLQWRNAGNHAFINGIGLVGDSGERVVSARNSMNYWLVSTDSEQVVTVGQHVQVTDTRGADSVIPDPSVFPPARRLNQAAVRYERFLAAVEHVLDASWGVTPVWMRAPTDRQFTAVTPSVSKKELIGAEESGVWDRKVAFLIKVQEPAAGNQSAPISFDLSAMVQSRKRNERNFTQEQPTGSVTRAASDRFLEDIARYLSDPERDAQ